MARWYDFSNCEYQFDELSDLRALWKNVPDQKAINTIAEAHQYYNFLKTMIINRLQSWSDPPDQRPNWHTPSQLALSARAGAVSSGIVVAASIVECAMRAHAENRSLPKLKKDSKHRTFGNVIHAWESCGIHKNEIGSILDDLKNLKDKRNFIHLYARRNQTWEAILNEETALAECGEKLITFFQNLQAKNQP